MAMVNMNNLLNGKDSRWLQLEVCREFQRNKCSRPDTECKFAHPPPNVEVQNGRVTACYDSIKGRCNREKPPCKYFHPPQHLKDQLLINGRNHLALKNAIMQQMGLTPGQPLVPGQVPTVVDSAATIGFPFTLLPANLSLSLDEHYALTAANPYLTGMPQVGSTYSPYFAPGPIMPAIMGPDPSVGSPLGVVPQTVVAAAQQKMPRSDRLEMDVKSVGSFYYENFTFPGMVPYKRPAADKSGMPVYQPSATTYQQLMQLQQPFVPVSCEYTSPPPPTATAAIATSLPLPPASYSSANSSSSSLTTTTTSLTGVNTNIPEPPKLPSSTPQSIGQTQTLTQAIPPPPIPSQSQDSDDNDLTSINSSSIQTGPDPAAAALAKEVAQQNYAKAIKLAQAQAQVSNSFGINPLTALSYTGVALNKHTLSVPPPNVGTVPRYHQTGLPFNLGLGLNNPYSAQQAQMQAQVQAQVQAQAQAQAAAHAAAVASQQSNLFAFSRPPPTMLNPYTAALLRPYGAQMAPSGAPQLLSQGLLTAQYPVSANPTVGLPTQSSAAAAAAAAAAQNNNNVVLQPYKKMKTT